jgi:type IV pilus assembly protein PilP
MKKNPSSAQYAACLLLLAMLFGCSKHEQPTAPAPPKAAQPAKPAVPAAPGAPAAPGKPGVPGAPAAAVQKQLSSAVIPGGNFDFAKRTDPFKPFLAPVVPSPGAPGPTERVRPATDLLPIQSFEVTKFKVSGIIAGLTENKALLIDPNGKGYVVQQGMLIGNNDGRIARITSSSVEVVESFKDDKGRIRKRKIVLTLAKKK